MIRKLNKREKLAVYAAAAVVTVFLAANLVVAPLQARQQRLERTVQAKREALREMRTLQEEFEQLQGRTASLEARFKTRPKGFTLFSMLDRLAGEAGVKDRIAYMKPSSSPHKSGNYTVSLVEMKLQGVTLKQVADYLYRVETDPQEVYVRRLSITRAGKDQPVIDAVLQVETLTL